MIKVSCDICYRDLQTIKKTLQVGNQQAHFCERCESQAEDYVAGVAVVLAESMTNLNHEIQRYRNKFIREKLRPVMVKNESRTGTE